MLSAILYTSLKFVYYMSIAEELMTEPKLSHCIDQKLFYFILSYLYSYIQNTKKRHKRRVVDINKTYILSHIPELVIQFDLIFKWSSDYSEPIQTTIKSHQTSHSVGTPNKKCHQNVVGILWHIKCKVKPASHLHAFIPLTLCKQYIAIWHISQER
jgi:hypothetical protein